MLLYVSDLVFALSACFLLGITLGNFLGITLVNGMLQNFLNFSLLKVGDFQKVEVRTEIPAGMKRIEVWYRKFFIKLLQFQPSPFLHMA